MKFRNMEIKWLGHSSFLIKTESKIICIDPYQISGKEKGDIILITHPHYDHCSVEDLQKIIKSETIIVIPADCQSKIAKLEVEMKIIDIGQAINLDGIKIGAVPAYNLDKEFHKKEERWLGYVIKSGYIVVYHAGDADLIPEMEKLKNISIALLPIGGTYTMTAEEAAEAASIIKPELAIPMHYGSVVGSGTDAKEFVRLCQEQGIKAEILEKE